MRFLTISVLIFVAVGLAPTEHSATATHTSPALLYTLAESYRPLAWMTGGERFPSGAKVFISAAAGSRPLLPDFFVSADPAISFDGKRVLFAGKRTPQDHWQIWQGALEGGDIKRITNCAADCIRPFYLPEDRIVYAEKLDGRFVIEAASLDGGKTLPLTYGPQNSLPTDILRDGRILFEATLAGIENQAPEIYTVYSDGSGIESYRCDHGKARHDGKQLASGDIVFADKGGLAKFTSALASQVPLSAPKGDYAGDVAETSSGEWLLPWRPDRDSSFRLVWWTPGQVNSRVAAQQADLNVVQPVIVAERVLPNRHPSGLHDWSVGNLLCLNAYTSRDHNFAAASIQSVRLYTKNADGVQLLGTAPVETDGSFFVQVPGDQPLQIELLDSKSNTLKREAGWFWLRRGEQRACVGCHAGPETSPDNAVPMVLLKSTTPADMTHPIAGSAAGGH